MRKLWYAGAGVIAGGLLFLGTAPAQASPQQPGPAGTAADAVRTELVRTARLPLTDANTGSLRLPVVGGLPIVRGILPDGSHTPENTPAGAPGPQGATGLPLGGSPVSAADLSPQPGVTGSPVPGASPYSSTAARPGMISPSASAPSDAVPSDALPSDAVPSAAVPSASAPVPVAPSSVAPASVAPASVAPASVAPSEVPYSKVDDPRLLEEPAKG
ncbi:hypothetical protein Acy02nite_44930 [Actinoplanes cyaneus]|uniref:Uncharacterized protein n=1 Tax=Actinoplanes cyaneus TaxID=52696 RepID=A0A919IJV4_9ACTN|nr:hypothetical protein [Actinoplanes cyaneus]MCW2138649.1 hypothetical protein [Actinoplanes cyaneus]GID66612.1 hypothetical protein Acy02nite_44930 [Actinoplanes cyaneus]